MTELNSECCSNVTSQFLQNNVVLIACGVSRPLLIGIAGTPLQTGSRMSFRFNISLGSVTSKATLNALESGILPQLEQDGMHLPVKEQDGG